MALLEIKDLVKNINENLILVTYGKKENENGIYF